MPIARLVALSAGICLAACSAPQPDPVQWRTFQADPFSLTLNYPAALFPITTVSRTGGDAQWMFGPNADGVSLLIQSYTTRRAMRPYQAACAHNCLGETYRLNGRLKGISAGHVAHQIYFSECHRVRVEMHCFHVIYPDRQRATYEALISRMHASFDLNTKL
jgi:hypothetical protein